VFQRTLTPLLTRSLQGLLAAATLALGLAAAGPAAAQNTKPAVRELGIENLTSAIFIGNSFFYYNNSLHGHLGSLLASATPKQALRAVSITISASSFSWHDVDSYFRPNAVSSYSFTPDNKIVMNKFDRLFDAAIMMDCSQCPTNPAFAPQFHEYAKKHADTVRKHGARPVFFMSWAYADAPEMTAQLAEAYTQAGNANGALVIPAGLAFARSVGQRPQLNLYAADKRHPSMLGTYLAAVTTYATLYRKSPIGLPYTAGIDEPTARFLQGVAWETVSDYFKP
jgi:thiol-disulfide isomerase/thioredoxin